MNIKRLFQLQEQHIAINDFKIKPTANWEALLGADRFQCVERVDVVRVSQGWGNRERTCWHNSTQLISLLKGLSGRFLHKIL